MQKLHVTHIVSYEDFAGNIVGYLFLNVGMYFKSLDVGKKKNVKMLLLGHPRSTPVTVHCSATRCIFNPDRLAVRRRHINELKK